MVKKWIAVGVFGVLVAALAEPALAQEKSAGEVPKETAGKPSHDTQALPGYVEFDHSKMTGALKPSVSVLLEGAMIKMAAAASAEADTPITPLLEQLRLVQVKVFEDIQGGDRMSLSQFAIKKIAELKENGWTPAVSVPEEGETVDVLVLTVEDLIQGLVVMVVEEDEIVFVNLAGDIDPVALGSLIGKLGAGVFTGDFDPMDLLQGGGNDEISHEEVEVEVKEVDTDENTSNTSEAESDPNH